MKKGLHEVIANTYCLQLDPPKWAKEVRPRTSSPLEKLKITIDFIAPSSNRDPETGTDFTEFDGFTSKNAIRIRARASTHHHVAHATDITAILLLSHRDPGAMTRHYLLWRRSWLPR